MENLQEALTALARQQQETLQNAFHLQNESFTSSLQQFMGALQPILAFVSAQSASPPPAAPADPTAQTAEPNPKIKLPKLSMIDGRNAKLMCDWFDIAESYMKGAGIRANTPEAVNFVAGHFTGPLKEWWAAKLRTSKEDKLAAGYTGYVQFREDILANYRTRDPADEARTKLTKLKQTGDIEDYCRQTITLNSIIPDRDEADRIFLFTEGLKAYERKEVVTRAPTTLQQAIRIASEAAGLYDKSHRHTDTNRPSRHNNTPPATTPMDLGNLTTNNRNRQPGQLVRVKTNTTSEEREQLRRENKCFICKKTGHIAPRCPTRGRPN
jgi:hypothetical protein